MRFSWFAVMVFLFASLHDAAAETVTIRPPESHDVLLNPGMGFTSFDRADSDSIKIAPGASWHPKTSIAYYRWYWWELEPNDGMINFAKIDSAITRAHACGQSFAFRVMTAALHKTAVPQWLIDAGAQGVWYKGDVFLVNYDDPIFLNRMERLVIALGQRYDASPFLDHVDIGSLGLWGEWQMEDIENASWLPNGTMFIHDYAGSKMPSREIKERIISWYERAFYRTKLVALINDVEGLRYATRLGSTGWRADCLGDLGCFSQYWNHMEDRYPQNLVLADAVEIWKTAPVMFEACWDMQYWYKRGWDVEAIFQYALDNHVSVFNNKSSPVPDDWVSAVVRFQKKMGYRLILRELTFNSPMIPGAELTLTSRWENLGVAPPYGAHNLNYRLVSKAGDGRTALLIPSDAHVWTWVPGSYTIKDTITIPNNFPPGEYMLQVGMTEGVPGSAIIKLAIDMPQDGGWYHLSPVTVALHNSPH